MFRQPLFVWKSRHRASIWAGLSSLPPEAIFFFTVLDKLMHGCPFAPCNMLAEAAKSLHDDSRSHTMAYGMCPHGIHSNSSTGLEMKTHIGHTAHNTAQHARTT